MRGYTFFFFFYNSCSGAGTVRKLLLQHCGCRRPRQLMTVIMSVAITTAGCSVTCSAICSPAPRKRRGHVQLRGNTPDMRTGSSSLTVLMEVTSICLCSWCVSSCCLSSIIFDILVIPEKGEQNKNVYVMFVAVAEGGRIEQNRTPQRRMSAYLLFPPRGGH